MTKELNKEYSKWRLEVNISKPEYMCVGKTQQNLLLENGQTIEDSKKYKYLEAKLQIVER